MPVKYLLYLIIFTVGLVSNPSFCYAQSKKAVKYYKKGLKAQSTRDFFTAIDYYKKAVKEDNTFIDAHERLISIAQLYPEKIDRLAHLEAIFELQPNNPRAIRYACEIGAIRFGEGNYKEALKYLEICQKASSPDLRQRDLNSLYIAQCRFANSNPPPDSSAETRLDSTININSQQYKPSITADGSMMVFSTRINKPGAPYDEDIYVSYKNANGVWSKAVSISDSINTLSGEGTPTISADGRYLVFTRCESGKSCNLFESIHQNGEWSNPRKLQGTINTPDNYTSHPSLSPDGSMLFFVSSRSGGFGSTDIFRSIRQEDGNWGEPINMGNVINTPYREYAPFLHPNGLYLFFSSDGHEDGFGRLDLYVAPLNPNTLMPDTVINLGHQFNGPEDNNSLILTGDGTQTYYNKDLTYYGQVVSARIYNQPWPATAPIIPPAKWLTGNIYGLPDSVPLASTLLMRGFGGVASEYVFYSEENDGKYLTVLPPNKKLTLQVRAEGYLWQQGEVYIADSLQSIEVDFYLKPLEKGESIILAESFFDVDSFSLTATAHTNLEPVLKFLTDNENIHIRVEGHTDSTGSTSYNNLLSTKRARSVRDYFVKQGVEQDRLSYKGYGESKPIIDSRDNFWKNRRIEMVITKK